MIVWIILGACVLAMFLVLELRKPKNFPPGPARVPLVGYLPYMKTHMPHKHLRDLSEKYGPIIGLFMPRKPWVIVNTYKAVNEVLLNDDLNARPESKFIAARSWDKLLGILFTSGELWQKNRNFSVHEFQKLSYGKKRHEDLILNDIQDMINEIKDIKQPFNIQKILNVSTINILWSILGGGHLKRKDPKLQDLVFNVNKLFQTGKTFSSLAYQIPILRPFLAEICGVNTVQRGTNSLRDFIMKSVEEHKTTMVKGEVRDFMDAYLQEMKESSDPAFSEEQLVATVMDFFTGGVESSTSLISFCIFYVCLHPSVQQRAHAEIDREVGRDRLPIMEDRKKLLYLDSVYTEVFRLRCPTLTTLPHVASKDTTLQGYRIPKGTIILPNLYAVFHDSSYWGDPGIFRPARFLDSDGKTKLDEHFFPFGKGKRSCLGEDLAKMTTFLTFVSLLQKYSFNFDPNMLLMETEGSSGFTLKPPPFEVVAKPRF